MGLIQTQNLIAFVSNAPFDFSLPTSLDSCSKIFSASPLLIERQSWTSLLGTKGRPQYSSNLTVYMHFAFILAEPLSCWAGQSPFNAWHSSLHSQPWAFPPCLPSSLQSDPVMLWAQLSILMPPCWSNSPLPRAVHRIVCLTWCSADTVQKFSIISEREAHIFNLHWAPQIMSPGLWVGTIYVDNSNTLLCVFI